MTLLEAFGTLNDADTMARIMAAIFFAAAAVLTEASTVTDHEIRLAWAAKAISGDTQSQRRVAAYLVTRSDAATILASDAALVTFVNGIVTALAKLPA